MKRPEIPAWMSVIAPTAKLGSADIAVIYKCHPKHVWKEVQSGRIPPHTFVTVSKRFYSKLSGGLIHDLHKWEMSAVRLGVAQRQKKFDESTNNEKT